MKTAKRLIDATLEFIRPHLTTWIAEGVSAGWILGRGHVVAAILEASRTLEERSPKDERTIAPEKCHDINYDQVITRAIADGAPGYNLIICGNPIAEYLPEGREIVLRHRGEDDAHLEGVVVRASYPVTYRSRGTVHFLTSLQTETTAEGNAAQLARLERKYHG